MKLSNDPFSLGGYHSASARICAELQALDLSSLKPEFQPLPGADAAKVLVWGFIAGFCEQFVPDLLSQFESRATSENRPAAAGITTPPPIASKE